LIKTELSINHSLTGKTIMSVKYLKIKIKSLASEAQMIRQEEHKTRRNYQRLRDRQGLEDAYQKEVDTFWGLRLHRVGPVRAETRDSLLAYAFIRGQSYRTAEATGEPIAGFFYDYTYKINRPLYNFNLDNIARLASKYGETEVTRDDIEQWVLSGVYDQNVVAAE
jgi:hypothetical protein